ncbi:unnamed protein product [Caenorhabditis angaria]|uniref:Uncharacterized protein n=1 Tax=Caenorhabditis angaria TaxID=860376 RepID=A0A9P1I6L8_9PELO|nr:unnamed protein product [Caenorhabditis angaria]
MDYPISETYDGPLENTTKASNIEDIPLAHQISNYPTEFEYEKLPEQTISIQQEEEKREEPSLKSKITGLFKKSPSHLDYPISETYDGPLENTTKASNIEDIPLAHQISNYPTEFEYEKLPEQTISIQQEEEKREEPSLKSKITGLFKKSPSHLDYPISETYDGPLENTTKASNIEDIPLAHQISNYPTEFEYEKLPEQTISIQQEEEKRDEPSLKSKITGLFKKSPSHLDYPISETYDGPLENTTKASNIEDIPLAHQISNYPTEFEYEKLPEQTISIQQEEEKRDEPSLKSKITGLFKKSPSHLDYPISETYDGPLENTTKASNIEDIPLAHQISNYPTEFEYEKLPEQTISIQQEEEKKEEPSLKSKITGLFKKSPSHLDYPISETYDGPLENTTKASNIEDIPLAHQISNYPTEFEYEKLPEQTISIQQEEEKRDEPSLKSKITGLFKKSPSHLDYPISETYDGPLENTTKASNIEDIPLAHQISNYPTEFEYEKLPEQTISIQQEEEKRDEPSLKSKITGLFKKSPSHLDYPISETYDGPLENTTKASNIEDIPLAHQISNYPTEFEYEKLPEQTISIQQEEEKRDEPSLKSKITGLFKKSPSHLDYPISETYDGPLENTTKASNIEDIPLAHQISNYPTEFEYEKLPEQTISIQQEEEKKEEPSLKSKITGLFKKSPSHLDYPISETYDGPLENTTKASNIEDIPLAHQISNYPTEFEYEKLPEQTISIQQEEEKRDEPSLKSKITGLFKKSPSHLDYPISETYDGPLENTTKASNIEDIPLAHQISNYPTEFEYEKLPEQTISIQQEEEKRDEPSLKSKITGLFKKSPSHLDYPISETYDGPLENTTKASNIEDIPLAHQISNYPTEFEYEKLPEQTISIQPEEEKREEPSLKSKITGLFKKSPSHLDYPISETYDGPLENTTKASNIEDIPLAHQISNYPTEFEYEKLPEQTISIQPEEEKRDEPSLKSKITGLFKKSPSHLDYPISETYDGPLENTTKASNIEDIPLAHQISNYPTEFEYEKLPEQTISIQPEEEKRDEPSLKSKITGLFKKSPSHLDYPISETYDGPLENTTKASNIEDIPLAHQISNYPTEFEYEKLPEQTISIQQEEEKRDEPSLKSKITGLFKKSPSHLDYPISETYDGPLENTTKASNIEDIPLAHQISNYPTEFEYEKLPEQTISIQQEEEKRDEPSLKSKITGLFKKSPSHLDYPISETYDGPLENTTKASNIEDIPLAHQISNYPTEFEYEKLPEQTISIQQEEEKRDEPSLKSKITGLFKKSPSHLDYPISETYDGPLENTTKASNIEDIPLAHQISNYPTEFEYEKLPEQTISIQQEEEKRDEPSLKSKITGLFKKSPSHLDYPISETYDGPLENTTKASNIEDIPLAHQISNYPTEFEYEKLPEQTISIQPEEEKKEEPSLKSKITGLFKKSPSHLDYPISETYDGPLENTTKASNIEDIPLAHQISNYPTEFEYEKLPEQTISIQPEEEKKEEPSLKSKITGLFKKSPSHLDYPISETYDGPLENTTKASNIEDIPLAHQISNYPTEFEYEKLPEQTISIQQEEEKRDEPSLKSKITGLFKKSPSHLDYPISETYDGPLENTTKASNIEDIPLAHQISNYPTEFEYEKLPEQTISIQQEEEKRDEPSLKSKITGLFKKSPSHLDYPISETYDGPLENTTKASNIEDIPLAHQISNYPTEFEYEKLPEQTISIQQEEEKRDEPSLKSKITGLFKKSPSHLDYPISETYDGPLENTTKASNIEDIPLAHQISNYPTEFEYEKLPEQTISIQQEEEKRDEPSLKSKITGLFKKSPSHLDYPISETYDGPLENTTKASNIEDIPLAHQISNYPTEFEYEKLPEQTISIQQEEEKRDEPSLKSKITGLFQKSPSHLDYPISETYDGPLENTTKASNIEDIPLAHQISNYPTEFEYEKLPEQTISIQPEEEKRDEPSLKSKITGLFQKVAITFGLSNLGNL